MGVLESSPYYCVLSRYVGVFDDKWIARELSALFEYFWQAPSRIVSLRFVRNLATVLEPVVFTC